MKKLLLSLVAIIMGGFIMAAPVFAECTSEQLEKGCVNTAILGENGCSCKSGETGENGQGITNILTLVVDILTVGIGILAAIGITIVGIQYLTAGGSEEQTRKAKRRMLEIVIGVAAYVVLYALLRWLLPAYNPSP